MKKILTICLAIFIVLTSCTKFEVRNEILPKINIVGDKIGLKYYLGPILVNDELDDISSEIFNYIKKRKNNLKLGLVISYNDGINQDVWFNYYIDGISIEENQNVVDCQILLAHRDKIKGFTLIELNGKIPKSTVTPSIQQEDSIPETIQSEKQNIPEPIEVKDNKL